jgi:phospholipase C
VSYATRYVNVVDGQGVSVHPSEPNYVWSEAGVHGPLNDNDPYPNNIVNAPSLSAELQAAGISWKSYQEDIDLVTSGGQLTNAVKPQNKWTVPLVSFAGTSQAYTNAYNGSHQYQYAAKHNPMVFFTATNGGDDTSPHNPQAKYYAPLQQLAVDLANNTVAQYNWITPDEFNDMHSSLQGGFTYHGVHYTGDQSAVAAGDNFLSQVVPMIEASQAFQNGGTIIIWDDENEGETEEDGKFTAPEIVISKLAKGNATKVSVNYTHSSDLRTLQEWFGLTPGHGHAWLGGSATSNNLAAMFQDGAVPALADDTAK